MKEQKCICPRFLLFLLTCALCLFAVTTPLLAQTSFPMIGGVYPLGVQRGKTVDVTVYAGGNGGANLYGAYKAFVEGAGVKAEVIVPEKGWPAKPAPDPKAPQKEWTLPGVSEVKLRVTVASDAPLGVRELRLGTARMGISSVGLLVVSDETQVLEAEPNNDLEHAQTVTLPCDVNGRIQQGEDIDCYKFAVTAGQEVTFAVQCARLMDKIHDLQEHADPLIVLRDLKGVELARNDDYYRADPLLHYKFEKAGQYVIQIRDVNYSGNPFWIYRLNITSRPYVVAAMPCAVRPGQSAELHVTGFNLGGANTAHVDVPANTPSGVWTTSLKLPNGMSNPIPLLVSDVPQTVIDSKPAPVVLAEKINIVNKVDPALKAAPPMPTTLPTVLTLPGSANSAILTAGVSDRYKFQAKKGTTWGFEVTARRLDSEMDSELKLRDAKGNVLAANDDAFGKDSRLDWTCPEDGEYTLDIRDLTGRAGPTYFYNLSAFPLRPDFSLKCDHDRAMISPGNRTAWFLILERKYGFAGDVKVEAKGLPPGVAATSITIPPQMTQGVIFLTAAPAAKIDMSEVELIGTAILPGADGKPATATRMAHPVTEIYLPGGGRGLLQVETQGVAVTEQNDLEVTVANPNVTIKPGETVKVEVSIKRRPDYTKPVTLDLRINHLGGVFTNPLPPGITVEDGATIPEGKTTGTVTLKAAPDAKPIASWPLAVMANASINFVMKVWYAAPISLTVAAPAPPAKK
jgi:hypothetical protein